MKNRSVFVICAKDDAGIYSTHGTFAGMEDAVGYGELEDARKFLSREDAQTYIDCEIPEWARECHYAKEVSPLALFLAAPELSCLLRHSEEEIPSRLLEPAKDCLLIWRR